MVHFRIVLSVCVAVSALAFGKDPAVGLDPDRALERLLAGNRRYVPHHEKHPDIALSRRSALARQGQHPFAVILGCSDSRVPPELIFDQGLGDLFVIRDAGNIVDDAVLGSIEYAVLHLGTRLILVLGHEDCGAIRATLNGETAEGHIRTVLAAIEPGIVEARKQSGDTVHNCVLANLKNVARQIRTSSVLKDLSEHGKIKVVAADYELVTGRVRLIE